MWDVWLLIAVLLVALWIGVTVVIMVLFRSR